MIPEFKFALREGLSGHPELLPTRIEPLATGWDVSCAEEPAVIIRAGSYAKIRLGFRALPPPGWWFELRPRSSSHAKKNLSCLYGVVDESYENEVMFSCQYLPNGFPASLGFIRIEFGERIGQIIPVRRQEMKVIPVSNEEYDRLCLERAAARGTGGFGSTG